MGAEEVVGREEGARTLSVRKQAKVNETDVVIVHRRGSSQDRPKVEEERKELGG